MACKDFWGDLPGGQQSKAGLSGGHVRVAQLSMAQRPARLQRAGEYRAEGQTVGAGQGQDEVPRPSASTSQELWGNSPEARLKQGPSDETMNLAQGKGRCGHRLGAVERGQVGDVA